MAATHTVVEILNKSLSKVAEIRNLYPLNKDGMILRYSKELSDYGKCTFRVKSNDPIFDTLGDILIPHTYNVRIKRGGTTVWQGAIVDNTQRNKIFIEVEAYQYLYYLDKILIRRTSNNPATGAADGIYRIFNSGTMDSAVTTLVNNAITDFGSPHPLAAMTLGTIENPNYPVGFTDGTNALSGAWSFSSTVQLQYDFQTVYAVIKAFGIYTNSDFEISSSLVFNFKKFLGTKQSSVIFQYDTRGNIVDYSVPRLGRRMVNDLWGIATDTSGRIYHIEQADSTSINAYGKLEDATGFADVKDANFLRLRTAQTLPYTDQPDGPINVVLNENGYPLGQYDVGDIVTIKIKDNVINVNQRMRVVGVTVNLHNTGREMITVQTNTPRDADLGA